MSAGNITLSPGERRALEQLHQWHRRGIEVDGFPYGFCPRGGGHRCAQRLVDLGLAQWERLVDESDHMIARSGITIPDGQEPRVKELLRELGLLTPEDEQDHADVLARQAERAERLCL